MRPFITQLKQREKIKREMMKGKEMKYSMLAFDLDGTLTTSEKKITAETKKMIQRAGKEGAAVVLASGRPMSGMDFLADELELDQYNGYLMAYNGGRIVRCKDQQLVNNVLLNPDFYKTIIDVATCYGINIMTYNDFLENKASENCIWTNKEDASMHMEARNCKLEIKEVPNLLAVMDRPVNKMVGAGQPEKLREMLPVLQKELNNEVGLYFSESCFMEIVPLGISKDTGLKVLLEQLNLDATELMAFGDGLNDLTMLKYAGLGVAMENGYQEAKDAANVITSSNDEEGISKALAKYFF